MEGAEVGAAGVASAGDAGKAGAECAAADVACAAAECEGALGAGVAATSEVLQAVAFVGDALAPLFLEEPLQGQAEAQLDALAAADVVAFADAWPFALPDDVLRAVELMQRGLSEPREDLMWEFRRLFVGPGALAAPPWGSTYTDRDGVIFGDSHTRLVAFMRAQGIIQLVDKREPSDHFGLMLRLMAWIARNKPEALREYLGEHFFMWSSHFLEGLAGATESAFYQGLALFARSTLEGVREVLAIDVEYPRYVR